jgi:hypothetical protein
MQLPEAPYSVGDIIRHRLSGERGIVLKDTMDRHGLRIYVATVACDGASGNGILREWWPLVEWERIMGSTSYTWENPVNVVDELKTIKETY